MAGEVGLEDHLRAAWAAHARGDRAAFDRHLEAARAVHPHSPVAAVGLLEAEALIDAGRAAAARRLLVDLCRAHPDNPWPAKRLAALALASGDLVAAAFHLDEALARDPGGVVPALRRDLVDLRIAEGDEAGALAVLADLPDDDEGLPGFYWRLSQAARARGDTAREIAHLEAVAARQPDRVDLQINAARRAAEIGDHDAVIDRLAPLADRDDVTLRILMPLLWSCRALRRTTDEVAVLRQALTLSPRDPQVLRYLFTHHTDKAEPALLNRVLAALPGQVPEDVCRDLSCEALLQGLRFSRALEVLRGRPAAAGPRARAEAVQLVRALFGTQRVGLALRYLRACRRRWPKDAKLIWLHVTNALRYGRFDEAGRVIASAEAAGLPAATILALRIRLHAARIDLGAALEDYARLRAVGRPSLDLRDILAKMIFTSLDLADAERVYAAIGAPGEDDPRLLHRAGLAGAMAMEFELERQAHAVAGGYRSLEDWVRARPQTPMPAIRLIDAWCADSVATMPATSPAATDPRTAEGAIPRHIYQYWNGSRPPGAVDRMMASWAEAPGFEHDRMSRRNALQFLRDEMGPDWVRAFVLAQDPAQEADLLRYCLLARRGGIWADADDALYGDLDRVLDEPRAGLVVYREPSGGALGNNFLAAQPGHPVMVLAARLACRALLARDNEVAWSKTGPGVLTRALGQCLIYDDLAAWRDGILVLDYARLAGEVAMHNEVRYKASPVYWEAAQSRSYPFKLWPLLAAALEDTTAAETC